MLIYRQQGFGGTNAHAILESYQPIREVMNHESRHVSNISRQFTFSSNSERSLINLLQSYLSFLHDRPTINLRNLAWTLQYRRTIFSFKVAFTASSVEQLCSNIKTRLEERNPDSSVFARQNPKSRRVMGVFTGQGAQWPAMGRELITKCPFAEKIMDTLEESLTTLPSNYRPNWSLKNEMLTCSDASRMNQGRLSQPLCTAVQIILVDTLGNAGVHFDSVIGHSSGEIAAAYSAGFISAHDAIRIAYFRGVFSELACGSSNEPGAMLAVGLSMEDAKTFCCLPDFKGRIQVVREHNGKVSQTCGFNLGFTSLTKSNYRLHVIRLRVSPFLAMPM